MHRTMCARLAGLLAALAGVTAAAAKPSAGHHHRHAVRGRKADDTHTATPIRHLVVIFQENVSFDHYFATYPNAANPTSEPRFVPAPGTPSVNGLTGPLLATIRTRPIRGGWIAPSR